MKAKQEQEFLRKGRREVEQQAHLDRMDALDAKLADIKRAEEDLRLKEDRARALKQKELDLAIASAFASSPSLSQAENPEINPSHQLSTFGPEDSPSCSTTAIFATDGSDFTQDNIAVSQNRVLSKSNSKFVPRAFPQLPPSPSAQEWKRQKEVQGKSNSAVDNIMDMTGLEEVKRQVLQVIAKIDASSRQNASIKQERFNVVLLGNPGTGS